jgi:hypothetical protein
MEKENGIKLLELKEAIHNRAVNSDYLFKVDND